MLIFRLGTEGKLHTVQVVDKNRDMRRTWMATIDLSNSRFVQLATPEIPDISLINDGNSEWVMASSNMPTNCRQCGKEALSISIYT
ncbi:MAG: hypothetical protein R2744_02780 [Bacteroidales bacterium]